MKNFNHRSSPNTVSTPEPLSTPTKPSSLTSSPFDKLPSELIGEICSHLDDNDRTTASVLNFRFKAEAQRLQILPWKVELNATNVTDYIRWMIRNPRKAAKVTHFSWNPRRLVGRARAKTLEGREKSKIVVRFSRAEMKDLSRRLCDVDAPCAMACSDDFWGLSKCLPRTKTNTYWRVDSVEVRDLLFGMLQWMPGIIYLDIGFQGVTWQDDSKWVSYLKHMKQLTELKLNNERMGPRQYVAMLRIPSLHTLHVPAYRCACPSRHPRHHAWSSISVRHTLGRIGSSVQTIHYFGMDWTYHRVAAPLTLRDDRRERREQWGNDVFDALYTCPLRRMYWSERAVWIHVLIRGGLLIGAALNLLGSVVITGLLAQRWVRSLL